MQNKITDEFISETVSDGGILLTYNNKVTTH